jgi:hypothetical protein
LTAGEIRRIEIDVRGVAPGWRADVRLNSRRPSAGSCGAGPLQVELTALEGRHSEWDGLPALRPAASLGSGDGGAANSDGACHPGRLMAPGPDPTFGAVLTVVPQAGCLPTAFRACGPSSCQHYSGHAKLRGSDAWSRSRSRRPSRSPPRTPRQWCRRCGGAER